MDAQCRVVEEFLRARTGQELPSITIEYMASRTFPGMEPARVLQKRTYHAVIIGLDTFKQNVFLWVSANTTADDRHPDQMQPLDVVVSYRSSLIHDLWMRIIKIVDPDVLAPLDTEQAEKTTETDADQEKRVCSMMSTGNDVIG